MAKQTEKLKLFKWDTSNQTDSQSQFGINKALNENWDKIDEAIGQIKTDITDLQENKIDKEEGKSVINALIAENTSLKSQIPCGQAEGESITIDDSSDLPIKKIEIGGKMEQETSTTGKNKFNLGEDSYSRLGIDVTIDKNRITLNGTTTSSNNLFITGTIASSSLSLGRFKAGTYRFSKFITSGSYEKNMEIGVGSFACYINKSDLTHLCNIDGNANSGTGSTITLTEDTDLYYQMWINAGAVFTNYVLDFQLEEGDSTTDLEEFIPNMPSIDYPSPIKCVSGENEVKIQNKNLLDLNQTWANGYISSTGVFTSANNNYLSDYININSDTIYTLSANSKIAGVSVAEYDENKNFITRKIISNNSTNTFTTSSKTKYIRVWFIKDNSTMTLAILQTLEPQLEKEISRSDYIEHQEQLYPISLGDIELYEGGYISLNYTEKAGYKTVTGASVYNEWSKHIMDGVTNKFKSKHGSLYTDTNGFYSLVIENKMKNVTYDKIKCNYLKSFNGGSFSAYKTTCLWNESNTNNMFASIPFLTLTDANKWLQELNTAGTPFEIVYPLETPTTTEITDETLLAQLEDLINAETYKNVTHIDTESENLKPNLKLTYRKDLETMFENINNSILSLGGNI